MRHPAGHVSRIINSFVTLLRIRGTYGHRAVTRAKDIWDILCANQTGAGAGAKTTAKRAGV